MTAGRFNNFWLRNATIPKYMLRGATRRSVCGVWWKVLTGGGGCWVCAQQKQLPGPRGNAADRVLWRRSLAQLPHAPAVHDIIGDRPQ